MSDPSAVESPTRIPFQNASGQTIPAFAVIQVDGTIVDDGVTLLACVQVGTTLATTFAINSHSRVRPGEKGICYRQGDVRVAFDGGSPAAGSSWGVRAGQWTLSQGYPSIITVHGIENAANNILYGRLKPLDGVLGVAGSDLPGLAAGVPGTGAVSVRVWTGSGLAPASPAMEFAGANIAPVPIKAGAVAQFVQSNGLWIADASAATLVRFELTANLVYGTPPTSPNAVVVEWDVDSASYLPTDEAIAVYDWTVDGDFGTWSGRAPASGISGYQGWAILKPDSNRHEIVWMESKARFIAFTLYSDLLKTEASKANCTVTGFWDGRDPDPSEAGVTVYNLASAITGHYVYAGRSSAAGYAVLDETGDHYRIVYVEPPPVPGFWQAALTATLLATDASASFSAGLLGDDAPASVVSAANTHNLSGINGDTITVASKIVSGLVSYWVMQVNHHACSIAADVKVDSATNTTKIQQTKRTLNAMTSSDDSADSDVVTLADQVVVDNVKVDNSTTPTKLQQTKKTIKRFPTTASDGDTDIVGIEECS